MSLKTTFFSQFGNPSGPLGRLAGHVMAAKADSRTRGRWTVDLLELEPAEHVLELGYGPGVVTGWLCDEVPDGHVVGVDRSATMRDQAAAPQPHPRRIGAPRPAGRRRRAPPR